MSTEPIKLGEDEGGELVGLPIFGDNDPYIDQKAVQSLNRITNNPSNSRSHDEEIGPVRRNSNRHGAVRSLDLRTFAFRNSELSTTIKRFRDEMYRNQFPALVSTFEQKCDECGTETDVEAQTCPECGADALKTPDKKQRNKAQNFFQRVNDDGQSLRALMEYEEDFQSFYGVSTIIIRKKYREITRDIEINGEGVESRKFWETEEVEELVHGDPLAVVPITDENNRHGGWWTCPAHRQKVWEPDELEWDYESQRPTSVCPECHAMLEEVGYAEVDSWRDGDVDQIFLKDEVVDWARHFPILNGLDGRSPIMPLIKLQALLAFNRNYELAFFDPANDKQLPNKMLLAYGKNIQSSLSSTLNQEEDKNVWEQGRMFYDGDPENVEVDIIDMTPSDALSGRDQMVQRLQQQVRAMFGVSDAIENELSDTGGMNAEGTQIEITNRAIASAQRDTKDQALDILADEIGLDDWEIEYVDPKRERFDIGPQQKVQAMEQARRAEIPYKMEDGRLVPLDHEFRPSDNQEEEQ